MAEQDGDGLAPGGEERAHRPMPSVSIPLLREERRSEKRRRVLFFVIAIVVLGAAGAGAVSLALTRSKAKTTVVAPSGFAVFDDAGPAASADAQATVSPIPSAAAVAPVTPDAGSPAAQTATLPAPSVETVPGGHTRTTKPFGTGGRGFQDSLQRLGLSKAESDELVAAFTGVLDFRRCKATDVVTIERKADGQLVSVDYVVSITEKYRVTRNGQGKLRGVRVDIPIQRTRLSKGGTVDTSLGDALAAVGLGRTLVGEFVEAFEGKCNFANGTRKGDTFRIIVEEQRTAGVFLRYGPVRAIEYHGQKCGSLKAYEFEDDLYDPNGRTIHGSWLRTPVRYDQITSGYDPRRFHPILKRTVPHEGIDFAAPSGTTVWAAANGTVTWVGEKGPNGNLVVIRHDGGYESFYAHLLRYQRGIAVGSRVKQRDVIGYVGSTGRSTGPHLHFGLKRGGRFVDPATQLNGPGRPLPASQQSAFRRTMRQLDAELERIRLPRVVGAAQPPGESRASQAQD